MTARIPAFIAVGVAGFAVQIAVLLWLSTFWHWPYPVATALAVEAAVLHNFVWHERWTWRDRPAIAGRPARTPVSLPSRHRPDVADRQRDRHGRSPWSFFDLPTLVANMCAVVATSLVNFLIADRWVFSPPPTASFSSRCSARTPRTESPPELKPETMAAWNRHVAAVEMAIPRARSGSAGRPRLKAGRLRSRAGPFTSGAGRC